MTIRAQFNLLSSSLSRSIRPELRASILDRTLSPAQVAVLSPVDFASAARLQEIEKAKQAVMQQTVKSRGDVEIAAVRLGRDGFEKVEDRHEKEMRVLAQQEEAARTSEKRRESMDVSKVETVEESPKMTREPDERPPVPVTLLHKRSESQDTAMQSPTKHTFAITSAWGDAKREEEAVVSYEGDQEALDLSDIVADPEDEVEFVPEPSEMEVFEAKPAVWSGGVSSVTLDSADRADRQPRVAVTTRPADIGTTRFDCPATNPDVLVQPPPAESDRHHRSCPHGQGFTLSLRQPAEPDQGARRGRLQR